MATDTSSDATVEPPAENRQPAAGEIRAQLERILASQCFQQAGRSSKFLGFVTEQKLTGQAERLKGYTIAIEVFGRPPDFDAQGDPLVRVEAGRLRRRLFEYYAVEGKHDELRVELPRGSYGPIWSYQPSPSPELQGAPAVAPLVAAASSRGKRRRRARALLAAAVLLVGSGFFAARELDRARAPHYPTFAEALAVNDRPPIVVLPFEDLNSPSNLHSLADSITEETLLLLNAPELFVVATEPRADNYRLGSTVPGSIGTAYVLSGSVRGSATGIRVTARLVIASTGTQVWANAFDEPSSIRDSAEQQAALARRIAAVADPYGPIFDLEFARISRLPPEALGARDCVVKYYEYRRSFDDATYRGALECFERATRNVPAQADAWAGVALLLAEHFAYARGPTPADDQAALTRALEAARRAMDIDGNGILANLALARVQFFNGQDFHGAADRALALRPNNPEVLSFVGAMLIYSGDAERGLELANRAIELAPRPPPPFYTVLAMGEIRQGRFDAALNAALKIDSPTWPTGYLLVAAAAGLAGRADVAERARSRALAESPRVEQELPVVLDRWHIDGDFRATLQRGLDLALASSNN